MSPSGRTSRASCTPCTPTAIPGSSPRDTSPTDHLPDRPLRGAPIADRPPKCPSSAPAARRGAIGRQGAPHRCLGLCPHAQVRASAHSTGSGVTLDSRPPAVCPGGAAPCRAQRERRDRHRQSERRQTPLRGARWLLEASGLTSSSRPRAAARSRRSSRGRSGRSSAACGEIRRGVVLAISGCCGERRSRGRPDHGRGRRVTPPAARPNPSPVQRETPGPLSPGARSRRWQPHLRAHARRAAATTAGPIDTPRPLRPHRPRSTTDDARIRQVTPPHARPPRPRPGRRIHRRRAHRV